MQGLVRTPHVETPVRVEDWGLFPMRTVGHLADDETAGTVPAVEEA